jgi:hypothetical protein
MNPAVAQHVAASLAGKEAEIAPAQLRRQEGRRSQPAK